MIRDIWILIAKKINGEATDEELEELDHLLEQTDSQAILDSLDWLRKDPASIHLQEDEELEQKWLHLDSLIDEREAQIVAQDQSPYSETHTPTVSRNLWRYLLYAASVTLFAGITYLFINYLHEPSYGITAVVAPQNGVSKISLPDGSSVWLNCGSKLSYRDNPETNCREVILSGEAYFDVVKDPSHPFTVQVPGFKIKVLGTAFNVRSYSSDPTAEATLVRGRIELTLRNKAGRKYILKPSERFSIHNPVEPAKTVMPVNTEGKLINVGNHKIEGLPTEVLWTKANIEFDDTPFEDVARMMEHKYNVSIQFKSDDIRQLKFTGKFKNESIAEAMKYLQATADFHYQITDNKILIYE